MSVLAKSEVTVMESVVVRSSVSILAKSEVTEMESVVVAESVIVLVNVTDGVILSEV